MRLLGLLGGQHLRDPQRVDAVGELLLEPLHQVAALDRVVDQHRLHGDAALEVAGPAADRADHAAVLDGRHHLLRLDRPVDEAVDALGDLGADVRRDVVAPAHHDVGAEAAHELLVGLLRVGDDLEAVGLGHLDDVPTERTRGTGHRERLPSGQAELLEQEAGGQRVHDEGRTGREVDVVREAQHGGVRDDDLVGVGPTRVAVGHHHGGDPVAHAPAGPLAHLVDDSSGVGTGDERTGQVGVPCLVPAHAQTGVGRVHRHGVHADAHLAGAGVRLGQVQDLQLLGAAELSHSDSSHARPNAPPSPDLPDPAVGSPRILVV